MFWVVVVVAVAVGVGAGRPREEEEEEEEREGSKVVTRIYLGVCHELELPTPTLGHGLEERT